MEVGVQATLADEDDDRFSTPRGIFPKQEPLPGKHVGAGILHECGPNFPSNNYGKLQVSRESPKPLVSSVEVWVFCTVSSCFGAASCLLLCFHELSGCSLL